MRRGVLFVAVVVVILLAAWFAYRYVNREAFVAQGPLPAPPEQVTFAGITPDHPFTLGPGNVLARNLYRTSALGNADVEVRDIMLPPHTKSQLPALSGPALLELYAGSGTLSLGDNSAAIAAGQMRSVPGAQALNFDNPGAYPLVVRLYILEAR